MFTVLSWVIFGLFVGFIAKMLHPGDDGFHGLLPTVMIGVCGSLLGGMVNFLISSDHQFGPAGIFMSISGSVALLYGYEYYLKKYGK